MNVFWVDNPLEVPRRTSHVEWIVCARVTREVDAARVRCPQGGQVAVAQCLDCHLLETVEGESARLGCATADG